MNAPGSGRSFPARRDLKTDVLDDQLIRIVVATMTTAIDKLGRVATARRFDASTAAAHIYKLRQTVAGLTLEALRTWPSGKDLPT